MKKNSGVDSYFFNWRQKNVYQFYKLCVWTQPVNIFWYDDLYFLKKVLSFERTGIWTQTSSKVPRRRGATFNLDIDFFTLYPTHTKIGKGNLGT